MLREVPFLGPAVRKLLGEGRESEVRVRDVSESTVETTDAEKNKHFQLKHFLFGREGATELQAPGRGLAL